MAQRTKQPVQAEDLRRLKILLGCTIAPDGKYAATMISRDDPKTLRKSTNIWLVPLTKGKALQYTCGDQLDYDPRFSPDGKTLAFISNRTDKYQVYLQAVDGGEARQLTDLAAGVWHIAWSPDGRQLCLAVPRQMPKEDKPPVMRRITGWSVNPLTPAGDLLLVDVSTGKTRTLVANGLANYSPVFSPDGKWLYFNANDAPDPLVEQMNLSLFKVSTTGKGKPHKIKTHPGPAMGPVPSPDGKWIAFQGIADSDGNMSRQNVDTFVVPVRGGKVRNLSGHLDRTTSPWLISDTFGHSPKDPPVWSPCSRNVYNVVQDGAHTSVHRFSLDGDSQEVQAGAGAVLSFDIDFAAGRIATVCTDATTPSDMFSGPLGGGKQRRLTRLNQWIARRGLGEVTELNTSARSGHAVQGWVLTPPGFNPKRKYPGILYIHGGPVSTYGPHFMHEFQYLSGMGYVVFFCNPRGSQGYGAEHMAAIYNNWGTVDYDDVMRFCDTVLRKCRFIDRNRLGVAGGSYGGYMTNWIIGHTLRFKAAVTQRTVANFVSWGGSNVALGITMKTRFNPDRTNKENLEHLWQMSPIAHLHSATTPTLVVQGEADTLTPPEQGKQIYGLLKVMGVETELLLFPEEGHELSRNGRLDRRIERVKAIEEWFGRYLK